MMTARQFRQRSIGIFEEVRQDIAGRLYFFAPLLLVVVLSAAASYGQAAASTEVPQPYVPPKTFIDPVTGHRVTRLTDEPNSRGLYFDRNAYTPDGKDMIYVSPKGMHVLNLATLKSELLVAGNIGDIVVSKKTRRVFYYLYSDGHTYAIDIDTKQATRLPRLPLRGHISSVNADETLLVGTYVEPGSREYIQYQLDAQAKAKPAWDAARQATADASAALNEAAKSLPDATQAAKDLAAASNAAYQAGLSGNPSASADGDYQAKLAAFNAILAEERAHQPEINAKQAEAVARQKEAETEQRRDDTEATAKRFAAREPEDVFTLNLQTGEVKVILKGNDWINHVEFSPTDPNLLLYDHEGPSSQVDRVWTIRADGTENRLLNQRTNRSEINTHEFWDPNGKTVWFDMQKTRGEEFAVAGIDVATGNRTVYRLPKAEESLHYNISADGKVFCGDGDTMGHELKASGVGHRAEDRAWIRFLRPNADGTLHSVRLAHLSHNNYALTEPSPRFSPDQKSVIFTSNMFGANYVYAVEVAKAPASAASPAENVTYFEWDPK